jgi:hypothetical protein
VEIDSTLERLAGCQKCGPAVQLLAADLEAARARLGRDLTRLQLLLPAPAGAKPVGGRG